MGKHRQLDVPVPAIPRALEQYQNVKLSGQVTYQSHTIRIPSKAVDDQFVHNLGALIRRMPADKPAKQIPSAQECTFCAINAQDCPQRVDAVPHAKDGITSDL